MAEPSANRLTMNAKEVAEALGLSRELVYREVRETGQIMGIPALRAGRKRIVFSRAQVLDRLGAQA